MMYTPSAVVIAEPARTPLAANTLTAIVLTGAIGFGRTVPPNASAMSMPVVVCPAVTTTGAPRVGRQSAATHAPLPYSLLTQKPERMAPGSGCGVEKAPRVTLDVRT